LEWGDLVMLGCLHEKTKSEVWGRYRHQGRVFADLRPALALPPSGRSGFQMPTAIAGPSSDSVRSNPGTRVEGLLSGWMPMTGDTTYCGRPTLRTS